jgi:hypothetical protein
VVVRGILRRGVTTGQIQRSWPERSRVSRSPSACAPTRRRRRLRRLGCDTPAGRVVTRRRGVSWLRPACGKPVRAGTLLGMPTGLVRRTGRPRGCSSMVEPQPSKLVMRVRFPSSALIRHPLSLAGSAQVVPGVDVVVGPRCLASPVHAGQRSPQALARTAREADSSCRPLGAPRMPQGRSRPASEVETA